MNTDELKIRARRIVRAQILKAFYITFLLLISIIIITVSILVSPKKKDPEEPESVINEIVPTAEEEKEVLIVKPVYYNVPLDYELQDYIRSNCEKYDVPMSLIIAIIEQESCFQADVISPTADYGLMQINIINHQRMAEELGVTDIMDPFQNVLSGIYLIAENLRAENDDIAGALLRYSNGPTGANRLRSKGVYITQHSGKILNAYYRYKEVI